MYYSFYLNERLALSEWDYYDECNWLLTHLLCKDETKTIEEKLDFYIKHRHERDENQWWYDDIEDKISKEEYEEYQHRKAMYEDFLECGGESNPYIAYVDFQPNQFFDMLEEDKFESKKNREAVFIKKTIRNRRMNMKLREIDKVILYKSDFAAIEKAKKIHKLNEHQTQILFGLIFFSRINDVKWCRVGTNYKWKSFKACFDKTVTIDDINKVKETGLITRVNLEKGKAYNQFGAEQAEYLHIESEYDFVYEGFDNQDEVAYEFITTKENNRLDLSKLAKEIIPNFKIKYCSICGAEFNPNSNRQQMCEACKEQTQKEQARIRKQRQRDREKGLLPKFEKNKKLTAKERNLMRVQAEYEKQKIEDNKLIEEIKEKPWLYC